MSRTPRSTAICRRSRSCRHRRTADATSAASPRSDACSAPPASSRTAAGAARRGASPSRPTSRWRRTASGAGDITYLRSERRGEYYSIYLVLDIWSRKIVAHKIHEEETAEIAAGLIDRATAVERIAPGTLALHSDNGSPVKGSTMLEAPDVATRFSRPRTSNDNAYSESAFKTLK